jgi:hypothetical protein
MAVSNKKLIKKLNIGQIFSAYLLVNVFYCRFLLFLVFIYFFCLFPFFVLITLKNLPDSGSFYSTRIPEEG